MIDRKLFQKTFSTLHASPDTLSEVYKVVRKEHKHRHPLSKGMLVAAVLAMCITVAGAAVGVTQLIRANVSQAAGVTDADLNAYDKDALSSDTPVVLDNSGQPLDLPRMERASTDAQTVQHLLGGYLSTVDATVEVDGYTIKLNTFLIDENGTGFLTYTLSNPDGVSYDEAGYGQVSVPMSPILYIGGTDGSAMDSDTYLDAAASTDTELHLVLYFSDFGYWHKGDDLLFSVNNWSDTDAKSISITPVAYLPVTTFTAEDGSTVEVSALGVHMDAPCAITGRICDINPTELTLCMKDGSRYVVDSDRENIMNWVVGLITVDENHDANGSTYSFNRLVDVDEIGSVAIAGHAYAYTTSPEGEDQFPENPITFDYTYTR